jgi:DHA1 family tetracycline resistance protein-like MFS transporter
VITWIAMIGTPLAGAAIDRVGRPQVWCAASVGLMAATLALMAAGAVPAIAAMAALGLVAAVAPPAFYSLPARLVPPERVGFAFGFITALSNLGAVVGPALAGSVRDSTPAWAPVWGTLAGVALAGAAVAGYVRPAYGSAGRS